MLIETGRDGYDAPLYVSFYEWIYSAFAVDYGGPGIYLFEPNIVNAFARRSNVVPVSGYTTTVGGKTTPLFRTQYHFGFLDTDFPSLAAAARDLGATHVIITELISYKKRDYRAIVDHETSFPAGNLHVESDNTRIEASVKATVISVVRQQLLFQRTFSASDDRFAITSRLVGEHNVRKRIAADILNSILLQEVAIRNSVQN